MIIHLGYEKISIKTPIATVGVFDGVHLGHMALLQRVIACARENKGRAVVITFNPTPSQVINLQSCNNASLSTFDEKIALLEKSGVDHLIVIRFTEEFSKMRAFDFFNDVLVSKLGVRFLVLGHDNRFGYRGEGTPERVMRYASTHGVIVEQANDLRLGGQIISSSSIREMLLAGKIEEANTLLGYNYSITGFVIKGHELGRSIGFPTANLNIDEHKLVPADGVYAVDILVKGLIHRGMLSIGTNPTFNTSANRSIEVNIFDFNDDIYGSTITVSFIKYLREIKKFDTVDDLTHQMIQDKEIALKQATSGKL